MSFGLGGSEPLAEKNVTSDAASSSRVKMSIIGWVVLGLIAGFIASKIVNKTGEGMILDIVLGIVGGLVGGCSRGLTARKAVGRIETS
jgi:F0F1-type ATP synthase assembly protein I